MSTETTTEQLPEDPTTDGLDNWHPHSPPPEDPEPTDPEAPKPQPLVSPENWHPHSPPVN
ncbi:hypothetical protein SAMN05421504_102540 [Amycolatopsis xylanica]|uniref:Uncharacterized protein n=1 Tax=Amycolatopsis xylanica TaxID=589385 RepID=A0A1H2ZKL1_9PSEU|nr:hypothetical protein [Amycolatopsis xylanica]SDX17249.1 hypothetical protein SAMN05421504_102540 [Amycolatopsis xylanica]